MLDAFSMSRVQLGDENGDRCFNGLGPLEMEFVYDSMKEQLKRGAQLASWLLQDQNVL